MKNFVGRLLDKHFLKRPPNRSTQILQAMEYDRVRNKIAEKTPENLALLGHKVYSQHDEDGIIAEIFTRISNSKTFMEIGIQDGTECNSLNLLLKGWRGVWIEGDGDQVKGISQSLGGATEIPGKLSIIHSFVDKENILKLCQTSKEFLRVEEVDFFSLDIDGNDCYILEKMLQSGFLPKVFCVEYNGRFPIGMNIKIKYNQTHIWDGSEYQGGSLQAYIDIFNPYNYTLICCNLIGINAFFVKHEYTKFFEIYEAGQLYQPCRYFLSPMMTGHPPTLRFLRDQIEDRL